MKNSGRKYQVARIRKAFDKNSNMPYKHALQLFLQDPGRSEDPTIYSGLLVHSPREAHLSQLSCWSEQPPDDPPPPPPTFLSNEST